MNRLFGLLLITTVFYFSCRSGPGGAGAIDSASLASQIKTLSADDFQGRKPFTPGEEKTIKYLENQFKALGLKPGNGDSYFQEVPMVEIRSLPAGNLVIKGKKDSVSLSYLDDYVVATKRVQPQVNIKNSELVFAGFGIVAPEYNWNDYAGLDVRGKTVIVMVNDPGFYDSTLFKGRTMTYYGRWTYKYEEAARQGATGIIIIHDTAPASYPWSVVRSSWSKARLDLQTEDNNMSRAAMEGWVSLPSAQKIFRLAGVPDSVMQQARRPGFKAVPLGLTTSLVINNSIRKSVSNNVLGLWPGTDRKDEYIIYSAHWDHLGIGEAIRGDSIYNGGGDNATGVAGLLQIAKAFITLKTPVRRSILFIALTGEEQGLLGSEYYAAHPVYPLKATVADINMDMLNIFGRTKDITIVGLGQSELDDYAARAAAKQGRTVSPEDNPGAGHFFRSDHFNFAKVGVPALYAGAGTQSVDHDGHWMQEQAAAFGRERYHSPFDEFTDSWNLSGMVEDLRLLFDIGDTLANETSFPKWKPGSEFKAVREKP